MSWKNRDSWHIDHIVPVSLAVSEQEVILLNHWSNLRPVFQDINWTKSDILPDGRRASDLSDDEKKHLLSELLKNINASSSL
jgi:hypothetical protein